MQVMKAAFDLCFKILGWFVAGMIFLFCVSLVFFTIVLMAYIVKEIIEGWKKEGKC